MNSPEVLDLCKSLLDHHGFECHQFRIGWYNSSITSDRYRLPYDDDVLAILVISLPQMFEITFLPWLRERKQNLDEILDPIDECMSQLFAQIKQKIDPSLNVDLIHDYEMIQGRYPRILMNTAGHVSGAACYYQKSELNGNYPDKRLFSVSVHPKYGGWFAFRAVLIFPQIKATNLTESPKFQDRITSEEKIYQLLHSFTYNWQSNEWRDQFTQVQEKYSPMQMEYFSRRPGERRKLLTEWIEGGKI